MDNNDQILVDTGREANHDLNFRQWSRSKHAQYFTPLKLANLICSMVEKLLPDGDPKYFQNFNILDPTCGTGRLLFPFKRVGANCIGIEFDKDVFVKAKQLIGKDSIRHGSILDYAEHLKYQFDVVVTNPPYGILWNQDETEFQFEGLSYANNIESQNATLQISKKALRTYNHFLFAIIPTSSFENAKDNSLRQFIYKNFEILLRVTIDNLFKDEYGIEVKTDLVVCGDKGYHDHEAPKTNIIKLDASDPLLESKILDIWKPIAETRQWETYQLSHNIKPSIPYLNNLVEMPVSANVEITPRGLKGDPTAIAMMDFYNETLEFYNPVVGKPTGIRDAYLESPALCKRGIDRAESLLSGIGFDVTVTDGTKKKIENLKEKFRLLSIPIYKPKDHQLLAYFEDREYKAKADVYDMAEDEEYQQSHRNGKKKNGNEKGNGHKPILLFKKGKHYRLKPSWIRQREFSGIDVIGEGKQKKTITTEIDRGFLSITVDTEQGEKTFREPEPLEVATILEAFDQPHVKDIMEERPELVRTWKRKLLREYPKIFSGEFDYQAEDLARILSKTKSAYIGYDMGGGKTVCGFTFNEIRKVKRVLVVCQSSLVENWINEAQKFGFKAERLTSHKSIDLLKKAIDNKIESKETIFYITSYEFLSLDTGRLYNPWTCIKYDKDGNIKHEIANNRSRTCKECSTEYSYLQRECPQCQAKTEWTGEYCHKCGYSAYTYSSDSIKQYPAYKRIKKLFRSVIIDETQQAKSKTSFRGRAVRSLHATSRLLLTGTLMKGYITDTFFNIGYVTRHNNPLFPYRFDRRGSKLFAEEFSTFEFKDIQFEDTLHKGRKKELPEVSNLNRFWKILSSFSIRRLKDEMVDLPLKTRRIMALTLDPIHASEYGLIVEEAKEKIDRELRKPEDQINMGVISKALWSMRFGATIPRINPDANVKIKKAIEIAQDAWRKGEKVLIYSALREMQYTLHNEFERYGIPHIFIPSTTQTKDRFKHIKAFQEDPNITAIVAGLNVLNRGFTITAANHVVFTDIEYSPESTDQAEDRAHRTGQTKPVTCYYLLIDWDDEKTNIDFKMFNLITQKKKAISNAIDGRVRFTRTAKVLSAGGDYLTLAKAITGEADDEREFEVEREGVVNFTANVVEVTASHDNGLWDKLYQEISQPTKSYRKKEDARQLNLF